LVDYTRVKVKVWEFIDKFRGKGFSMATLGPTSRYWQT